MSRESAPQPTCPPLEEYVWTKNVAAVKMVGAGLLTIGVGGGIKIAASAISGENQPLDTWAGGISASMLGTAGTVLLFEAKRLKSLIGNTSESSNS